MRAIFDRPGWWFATREEGSGDPEVPYPPEVVFVYSATHGGRVRDPEGKFTTVECWIPIERVKSWGQTAVLEVVEDWKKNLSHMDQYEPCSRKEHYPYCGTPKCGVCGRHVAQELAKPYRLTLLSRPGTWHEHEKKDGKVVRCYDVPREVGK